MDAHTMHRATPPIDLGDFCRSHEIVVVGGAPPWDLGAGYLLVYAELQLGEKVEERRQR